MSAPALPANICRVVLRRTWEDVVTENVFHVWSVIPHTSSTVGVVLAAIEDWWNSGGIGVIAGPSAYDPVHPAADLRVVLFAAGYVRAFGLGPVTRFLSTGLGAEADVPAPQASVVVRWLTGYGGRGRTGRSYHGLVTSGMYEGEAEGRISHGVRDGLVLAYQLLISKLTTGLGPPGTFAPVLVHYKPVTPSDSSSGLWDYITDCEITDRRVRTQRRRVPRDQLP